nr:hypothetical protein [uncultured Desulfuromusa sp.]
MLYFSGTIDALTDDSTAFGRILIGQIFVRDSGDFDMEINSIEQWSGKAIPIALQHRRSAGAIMLNITRNPQGQGFMAATSMKLAG